jgi:hypothetical protein
MTEGLSEIVDFWVQEFLAELIEGLKMSDERKDQRVLNAVICTYRMAVEQPAEGFALGEWKTGICVSRFTGGRLPIEGTVVVDLDGKVVDGIFTDIRPQFFHGMLTATGKGVNTDPVPEEWPKPQDLAAGVPVDAAHLASYGLRTPRHDDFVLLVQTEALSLDILTKKQNAGGVVATALEVPPPDDGDLREHARDFARWKHANISNGADWKGERPKWVSEEHEDF